MEPDWDALKEEWKRRREKIARDNDEQIRSPKDLWERSLWQRVVSPPSPSESTLKNLEDGGAKDWGTLTLVLPMYGMGWLEFLNTILPGRAGSYNAAADLLAKAPWLNPVVERLASSPAAVGRFVLQGLGLRVAVDLPEEGVAVGNSS